MELRLLNGSILRYGGRSKINVVTLAKLFEQWLESNSCDKSEEEIPDEQRLYMNSRNTYDDVDMEPQDDLFESTLLVDAKKQEIREKLEEYFYLNNRVYEELGLDEDGLVIMEDYLELNPRDEFIDPDDEYETDEEYEEYEKWKYEQLGIPYHKHCYVLARLTLENDDGKVWS